MSKTVVLITIDALKKDHMGCYGYQRNTTPFLDSLAEEGFVGKNAFATGTASAQCLRSILSSTYPLEHDDYDHISILRPYVADLLAGSDVRTVGVHSNIYASRAFGFERNFDSFYDGLEPGDGDGELGFSIPYRDELVEFLRNRLNTVYSLLRGVRNKTKSYEYPYKTAEKINQEVFDRVEETGDQFVWVHYMDPHEPYIPPETHIGTYSDSETQWEGLRQAQRARENGDNQAIVNFYDESLRYVDQKIEELHSKLTHKFEGDVDFIITNDHGECLGQNGILGHPHEHITPQQLSSPFIAKTSDEIKTSQEDLISDLDILPTVLDILGISEADAQLRGESILESTASSEILSETAPYSNEDFEIDYSKHKTALIKEDERIFVEPQQPYAREPGEDELRRIKKHEKTYHSFT